MPRGLSEDHAEALSAMIGALADLRFVSTVASTTAARLREKGPRCACQAVHRAGRRACRAPCPKFHADTVPMRLIATLAGRGTEVHLTVVYKIGNNGPTTLSTLTSSRTRTLPARSSWAASQGRTRRPLRLPAAGPPRPGRRVVLVLDERRRPAASRHARRGGESVAYTS